MIQIHSLQAGLPATYEMDDGMGGVKTWRTAIFKRPVAGPVRATLLGLEGDGQADKRFHGGRDKALNVFCFEHYAFWVKAFQRDMLPLGAFGENLTLTGALEADVCIGDIFEAADVRLQISQPRQPCGTLARRWEISDLVQRIEKQGSTGWYFRVLQEGLLKAGDALKLIERANPKWTVSAANDVMHFRKGGAQAAHELAALPALSEAWRETLVKRK